MARQLEESIHALERTDELPVLGADAVQRFESAVQPLQPVPELTEIVASRTGLPGVTDSPAPDSAFDTEAREQALLERRAAHEAFIAGQNDHLLALETELSARTRRIAELEACRDSHP
jgi:hypothetical protein